MDSNLNWPPEEGRLALAIWAGTCTVLEVATMLDAGASVISVTQAASMGISSLVRDAEAGRDVVVSRRNRPVAVVVGMQRLAEIRQLESDLRDLTLVLARTATDYGRRMSLDDAISAFGFDRSELEAELDGDLAAGRD